MTTLVTTCHKGLGLCERRAGIRHCNVPVRALPLSQAASESRATRLRTLVTTCHKDRSSS
jgi:hypothetical protein